MILHKYLTLFCTGYLTNSFFTGMGGRSGKMTLHLLNQKLWEYQIWHAGCVVEKFSEKLMLS